MMKENTAYLLLSLPLFLSFRPTVGFVVFLSFLCNNNVYLYIHIYLLLIASWANHTDAQSYRQTQLEPGMENYIFYTVLEKVPHVVLHNSFFTNHSLLFFTYFL